MNVTSRGISDVGRKREHNEDSLLIDDALGLYIVADGMGGHQGGGTASRLAVETIRESLRAAKANGASVPHQGPLEENPLREVLRSAVERACRSIFQAAQTDPGLQGMGTTVTALALDDQAAFVAHVGDSRCYLIRGEEIFQVSEDHSLVNEQLKAGAITPEEARTSRFRNIITRSVGFEEQVAVDLLGLEVKPGDRMLVCCDGLSNLVEDGEILQVVREGPLEAVPQKLVDLANDRGGDDNITVIVLQVGESAP
ncbi:MAG: Stp1/IreP family PP2C-type Ser/Thr phosphatase [Deltaproteobacteria bacterium]|nr:Stp1/IreP family PP2C-type Ser/Thr phosphatase [Deltaproteobacteria bacterium]